MRTITLITLLWLTLVAAIPSEGASRGGSDDREQWMTEMRQYKRIYMTKELELSREQQTKFYPLYEEMEDAVAKVTDESRAMERRVAEMDSPSDLEYEKATEAMFDADVRSAQIEREYMDKFKTILSKKQLFRLKAVERQFTREMMRQHQRLRSKANSKK